MRINYLAFAFQIILRNFGFMALTPVFFAVFYKEYSSILPFVVTFAITILISFTLKILFSKSTPENLNDIKKSEGLFIVSASWILGGIIASLPYLFYGMGLIDAFFEASSGITTTGASICSGIDYPKSIYFWRALTQWLGGMGIIVLFIAILPQFAVAGRQMFFAESPGPTEEKFTPRIRSTATALWKIYTGLTLLETILLKLAGMPLFDAFCNSLSTLSAGGFSTNAHSTFGYHSYPITWIILIFMVIAGINFNLQYKAITRFEISALFKNEEFRAYISIFLGISALVAISLFLNDKQDIFYSITHSLYQTISIMTSTGSASVDYTEWNFTTKVLLFIAAFTGGCASSASGGIKIARWVLIGKIMSTEVKKILHPNAVINVKMDNNIISREILSQTVMFISFYIALIAVSVVIVAILEQSIVVGISGSVSAIGNIGPGFGQTIGPMSSYETLHPLSKLVLIFDMYVGRLELIPFLVMFEKDFWTFK
ncbi:MAG: TrkH family potassium uptake protein [Candidatus Gastranaerophilales bacterium]|nr:TrkH family potassium uptake protein [Candidatus Gastranaerophilales bacterium]